MSTAIQISKELSVKLFKGDSPEVVGIDAKNEIYQGYDNYLLKNNKHCDPHIELYPEERAELARYMIARWSEFGKP